MALSSDDLQDLDLNTGREVTADDLQGLDLGAGVSLTPTRGQEFVQDIMATPILRDVAQGTVNVLQTPIIGRGLEIAGTVADYFAAPIRGGLAAAKGAQGQTLPGYTWDIIKGIGKPLIFGPSSAPTGTEMAEQLNFPSGATASTVAPWLYSETGEGLPLKKGSYFDPTATDISAGVFNLLDPGLFTGGKLAQIPMLTAGFGAELGAKAGRGTVKAAKILTSPETKIATEAMAQPYIEKLEDFSRLFKQQDLKVAPTFDKQLAVLQKNKIDPELMPASIKYGPESSIAKYEKSISEGTTAKADELVEKNQEFHNAIKYTIDDELNKLSPTGEPSAELASQIMSKEYRDNFNAIKDLSEAGYDDALIKYGDIQIFEDKKQGLDSLLGNLRKQYEKTMNNAPPHAKGKYKNEIEWIDAWSTASNSYESLLDMMRELDKKAYATDNTFDNKTLKSIRSKMKEALLNSIGGIDKELKTKIIEGNKNYEKLFNASSKLEGIIGNKNLSDLEKFNKIMLDGTAEQIRALKVIFPEDAIAAFKAAYLREGLNPLYKSWKGEGGQQLHTGYIQSRSFLTERKNREKLSILFSKGELDNLKDLINIGDRAGAPYMSTSRTSVGLSRFLESITNFIAMTPESLRRKNLALQDYELATTYGFREKPLSGWLSAVPESKRPLAKKSAAIGGQFIDYAKPAAQQLGRQMNLYGLDYNEQNQDRGR